MSTLVYPMVDMPAVLYHRHCILMIDEYTCGEL